MIPIWDDEKCECHGEPVVLSLPPNGWPRCQVTGHRVAIGEVQPRQTRYNPGMWLFEHVTRRRARQEGRNNGTVK